MSNPRQTTVNVTLSSINAQGNAVFTLQPVGDDPLPPPSGPNQTLTFQNDPHGVPHNGVTIDFVLIDQTGQGYAFPPNNNKAYAVSSAMGPTNGCPAQGTNEVLSPVNVSPDNKTLSVHNPNQNQQPNGPNLVGNFSYVLWVTKTGGAPYVPLDPGGNNMNGAT